MYNPIPLTNTIPTVGTSVSRPPWRRRFVFLALALACFAFSPHARTAGTPLRVDNLNGDSASSHNGTNTANRFETLNTSTIGFNAVWARAASSSANRSSSKAATLTFTDVTAQSGIVQNNCSWGSAWADYDNDGYIDVMTVGHLLHPHTSICQLWHNNGDETFTEVTAQAGLIQLDGDCHGAVWGDFDSDGDLDLYVSKGTTKDLPVNYNDLWLNNGDGTFTNVASSSGVTGIDHRNRGTYAVDYDNDSNLDIFATSFFRTSGGGPNLLFHNDGGLQFTDVAQQAGIQRTNVENRTAAWADFDGDGFMDVFITKSGGLFKNRGDGTFVDVTATAGITTSENAQSGTWGDFDNDGNLDLYVTMGIENGPPVQGILYRNNGDGTFTDITIASGAINVGGALGATWGDYDNDGYLDLYIVNTVHGFTQPNRLFRNNGDGTFTDVASTAGVGAKTVGRGSDATFVDYNNDGFLDLFVCNGAGSSYGPYLLFHNNGNSNGWLEVSLIGQQSNRGGIGAKLSLTAGGKTQFREYTGQHYMSQNHIPIHFGLGDATIIDSLTIQWPSGITQTLDNIAVNQSLTITESASP